MHKSQNTVGEHIDSILDALAELKRKTQHHAENDGDGYTQWTWQLNRKLSALRHWSDDPPLISDARASLDCLKRIVGSLGFLSDVLQEDMALLRSALQPHEYGRGINSFPDDVLSVLFQWIWTAEPIHGRATVARICSRFRRVAINLPRYWSYISPFLPSVGYAEKSLARSKAASLDIHLVFSDQDVFSADENNIPSMCPPYTIRDLALDYSERWGSLRVHPFNVYYGDKITSEEKCSPLMGLNLPRLRHLFIESVNESYSLQKATQNNKYVHFYSTLKVPSLQFLRVENIIPRLFDIPPPKLAIFELKIGKNPVDIDDLIPFLATVSSTLEELSLEFCEDYDEIILSFEAEVVTLGKLKRLRYRIEESKEKDWYPTGMDNIRSLERGFITPNLQRLDLTVEGGPMVKQSEWLEFLFEQEYPALRELSFTYEIPGCIITKTVLLKRTTEPRQHVSIGPSLPFNQYILHGNSCFCSWMSMLRDRSAYVIRGRKCFVHDKGCSTEGSIVV